MMHEVAKSKYWSKAICKAETCYNKTETPIPINNIINNNNILDEVKPY